MAGHLALKKEDEPKIFALVNKIRKQVIVYSLLVKDFEKFKIGVGKTPVYEIMKLSKEYVDNPEKECAFNIGKFSLESITDEHPSLIKNISLECHFIINGRKTVLKDIFWVA